jgi:hypothetical protein
MRSFSLFLAVMLAFSAATPGALADDDPPELAPKLAECRKGHQGDWNVACAKEREACAKRMILEEERKWRLKKGMTYEEALNVMGRQRNHTDSKTYGNGVVAKIYRWFFSAKSNYISVSFIDGRLSQWGGLVSDDFTPKPDISCGW